VVCLQVRLERGNDRRAQSGGRSEVVVDKLEVRVDHREF
jgi:hypothetical protein